MNDMPLYADMPLQAQSKQKKIAVALHYGFGEEAPTVIAKGRGDVAEHILQTAEAHEIAIEQNPLLAEALSKVALDETIPLPLYQAVAEVIGFVLRMGKLQRPAA